MLADLSLGKDAQFVFSAEVAAGALFQLRLRCTLSFREFGRLFWRSGDSCVISPEIYVTSHRVRMDAGWYTRIHHERIPGTF